MSKVGFYTPQGRILGQGIKGDPGEVGPQGPQGPQGDPGPNLVSTTTDTNITGLLKGAGGKVAQAVANTDYETPSNAQSKVDTHASATSGIHGVGASSIESVSGSQAKVNAHASATTGIHGVGASTVESVSGSQAKVDTHAGTNVSASVHPNAFSHINNTNNPHSTTASQVGALPTSAFSGLTKITVGTTQPSSPSVGDLWVDTN